MKRLTQSDLIKEKKLFETWLDIHYAAEDNEYMIKECIDRLKDLRKSKRAIQKSLTKIEAHYEEVYGKKPEMAKKYK